MSLRRTAPVAVALLGLVGLPMTAWALNGERDARPPAAAVVEADAPEDDEVEEPAGVGSEHAEAMKAWTQCVREAMAVQGPDKVKPWQACPDKPLAPGRAKHDLAKPTPPGHAGKARPEKAGKPDKAGKKPGKKGKGARSPGR